MSSPEQQIDVAVVAVLSDAVDDAEGSPDERRGGYSNISSGMPAMLLITRPEASRGVYLRARSHPAILLLCRLVRSPDSRAAVT